MTKGMYSSETDNWATPQWLFDELNEEFHFTLDPCASNDNHKCDKYYTEKDDGLIQDWGKETVFCNQPYGRQIGRWVEKCFYTHTHTGNTCVMLVPARTDTGWFHKYIYGIAEIRFIKGRLRFGNSTQNAPFPSMIVVYRKTEDDL